MADSLIELARALSANTNAGIEFVQKSVNAKFTRNEKISNQYFDIYDSQAPLSYVGVSSIEARVNRETRSVKIYVINVKPEGPCLKPNEIIKSFGSPQDFQVAPPRNPAVTPNYYVYKFPKGELRFGISRGAMECCSTIVIEFAR